MPIFRDVPEIIGSYRGKAGRHYAQMARWYPAMHCVNTIAGPRHSGGTIEPLVASVTPPGVLLVTVKVTQLRALPLISPPPQTPSWQRNAKPDVALT